MVHWPDTPASPGLNIAPAVPGAYGSALVVPFEDG
jgi:hypothetical protein